MDLKLKNKVAFISGASHGIGLEIAKALLNEGAYVHYIGRRIEVLESSTAQLGQISKNFTGYKCDVEDFEQVAKTFSLIEHKTGPVDIVINNVGGGGRWGFEDLMDTDMDVWRAVMEKNYFQTINILRLSLPYMIKKQWGRYIFIGSIYGKEVGGRPWFNSAKMAQSALSKNLSRKKEYASANITFNVISPGPIMIPDTGWATFAEEKPKEYENFLRSEVPQGRLGLPEEVAVLAAFLASPVASLINGANIQIDGGTSHVI